MMNPYEPPLEMESRDEVVSDDRSRPMVFVLVLCALVGLVSIVLSAIDAFYGNSLPGVFLLTMIFVGCGVLIACWVSRNSVAK